jgi:hypothetical protein
MIKRIKTSIKNRRWLWQQNNIKKAQLNRKKLLDELVPGGFYFSNKGHCVCCDSKVTFEANDSWLRDSYFCLNCKCKPRERALMHTIETYYPNWKELAIHESSPIKRGASVKINKNSKNYLASQYYPNKPFGSFIDGFRNEDLENQTFENELFDIVITSDVMEHVYNPEMAFKEIARTLKIGGSHIFTVPIINKHKKTEVWATLGENGAPNFLKTPEFHGNPVDPNGSPVTMHWGYDIVDFIKKASGLDTDIVALYEKELGIMGEYNEVFVTTKK